MAFDAFGNYVPDNNLNNQPVPQAPAAPVAPIQQEANVVNLNNDAVNTEPKPVQKTNKLIPIIAISCAVASIAFAVLAIILSSPKKTEAASYVEASNKVYSGDFILGSSCTDAIAEIVDGYTYENSIQRCLVKLKFSQVSPVLEEISNMEFMNTDPLARKLVERVINIKNQISDKINEGKLLENISVVDAWHKLTDYESLVYSNYEATRRKALEDVIEELENSGSEQLKEIADDIRENIEEYATNQKNNAKRRLEYQKMGLPDYPVFTESEKIAIKLIELEPLYAQFASYSNDMIEYIKSAHSIEVDFPTTNPEKEEK